MLSGRSSLPISAVLLWGLSIKLYPHHMIWQPEAGKVGVSCEAPLTGHSHVFSTMISDAWPAVLTLVLMEAFTEEFPSS